MQQCTKQIKFPALASIHSGVGKWTAHIKAVGKGSAMDSQIIRGQSPTASCSVQLGVRTGSAPMTTWTWMNEPGAAVGVEDSSPLTMESEFMET